MNKVEHSRFDEAHYVNCEDCYADHSDFVNECEMDAKADEAEFKLEETI